MRFFKYHALGNDYLVLDPTMMEGELTPHQIRVICHRNYGVGSDGVLLGPLANSEADFGLRLFNPDGSEFEKSGNGLRIFSRYLWDRGLVQAAPFTIQTPGGTVTSRVHHGGKGVTVDMGRASFHSSRIPLAGSPREVIDETITIQGQNLRFCAVTMGNPHCVVLCDDVNPAQAQRWGPLIERDPRFPSRTNVQFMKVLNRSRIQIEIWERGVGYTLASGTSSCAAAAVARRLGLCNAQIIVEMPGGAIDIYIFQDWSIRMTGPVTKVCDGTISSEMMQLGADDPAKYEAVGNPPT